MKSKLHVNQICFSDNVPFDSKSCTYWRFVQTISERPSTAFYFEKGSDLILTSGAVACPVACPVVEFLRGVFLVCTAISGYIEYSCIKKERRTAGA